jgi:hypothetical protein
MKAFLALTLVTFLRWIRTFGNSYEIYARSVSSHPSIAGQDMACASHIPSHPLLLSSIDAIVCLLAFFLASVRKPSRNWWDEEVIGKRLIQCLKRAEKRFPAQNFDFAARTADLQICCSGSRNAVWLHFFFHLSLMNFDDDGPIFGRYENAEHWFEIPCHKPSSRDSSNW